MGEQTKIEWCDHTWNPWFGCQKVSPACDFCYAEALMDHRYGKVTWGPGEKRVRTSAANWKEPYRWDRAAQKAGRIDTVFCLSLGDIWDNEVPDSWRREAFQVMDDTPNLRYLLLSKRIGNAVKMCDGSPLPRNAALGATMVNQEEWDRDLPKLKHACYETRALFTFASVEPMLGPIDARGELPDWVIVGGESGKDARPMHPDWPRGLRDQCKAAEVPFFFKQHGEWIDADAPGVDTLGSEDSPMRAWSNHRHSVRVGKKAAGRLLDGVEHNGLPLPPPAANSLFKGSQDEMKRGEANPSSSPSLPTPRTP